MDINKGKVGTVYSLSKNWKPQWGGNLHFMEDDYKTINLKTNKIMNDMIEGSSL